MSAPQRIDWGALMRAGLRERGLLPHEFWALTPAELTLMLGRDTAGAGPMGRARLDELAALWPDADPSCAGDATGKEQGHGQAR